MWLKVIGQRMKNIKKHIKQNKTTATIIVDKFPSLIDGHARSKPEFIAANKPLPEWISSLVLSAIKIFASTAKPKDNITAAAPDKVNTTGTVLKIANKIIP